jgi:hypothetical protein
VALAVALCVTMLVVYVLTLGVKGPDVVQSMAAAPRVTRQIEFEALEGWCVRMGKADTPEAARLMASAWVGQGSAGYVTELDGAWTVLGAVYDSEREARRIADRLAAEAGVEADVLARASEARSIIFGTSGNLSNQEDLLKTAINERQKYIKGKYGADQRLQRLLEDEQQQIQRIVNE